METSTFKPFGQDTAKLTDKVADTASGAIRSTQDVTNAAFDRLAVKVDTAREQVAPVADRLSMQAQEAARQVLSTGKRIPGLGVRFDGALI